MPEVTPALRAEVRSRAKSRCEYCMVLEFVTLVQHEVDHVIATKHGGRSVPENLALCCALCNKHKGSDLASIDPATGELTRLFHPRLDNWHDHFELRSSEILARTPVGRVTVRLLQLNRTERVRERAAMIQAG